MDIISSGCVACDGVLVAETQTNCSKVDGDYKSDAEGFQELEPNGHESVNKSLEKAATLPSEDDEPEAALQLLFSGKSDQPALQVSFLFIIQFNVRLTSLIEDSILIFIV